MSRVTYNPHCVRVGESIGSHVSLQPLSDGGVSVANHYGGVALMRDLDRGDALTLFHWLGDHLMRYMGSEHAAARATASPEPTPGPEPEIDIDAEIEEARP